MSDEGLVVADDDGAWEPFGHGQFLGQGIVTEEVIVKEFYNVVVELLSVDVYSGCSDASHAHKL